MPVIVQGVKVGLKLRFIGNANTVEETPDTTFGKVYKIAGHDEDGDPYYYDDRGEKNYAASPTGLGLFELA